MTGKNDEGNRMEDEERKGEREVSVEVEGEA